MTTLAARLDRAIRAAGVAITGVSILDEGNKATWTVRPANLQSAAQATIDAFNVNDPAHDSAELNMAAIGLLDTERIFSAIVWVMLKHLFPSDTDAQTRTKYGIARTNVIAAFKTRPWIV